MISLAVVIAPLTKALGLAIVVERVIELCKHIAQPVGRSTESRVLPAIADAEAAVVAVEERARNDARRGEVEQRAADRADERAAEARRQNEIHKALATETDPAKRAKLLAEAGRIKRKLEAEEQGGEVAEQVPPWVLVIEPASDPDDGWTLRELVLQLIGLAAGIIAATFADVRLFSSFLGFLTGDGELLTADAAGRMTGVIATLNAQPWIDHVLTGLFIGGGSSPVHQLIQFITARKDVASKGIASAETDEDKAVGAPAATAALTTGLAIAPAVPTDDWIDIPYAGGVDLEKLESVHRRKQDPTLIVYHHTAMSSASTFEDVVRTIKDHKDSAGHRWLTGYHCVITADGLIHAFCRWDRYGNHAVGHNAASLGISFNGNFEPNAAVPYSNPDGRYGAMLPSEVQLDAGARVVALWTLIYPIRLDFKKSILPHREISSKSCPGSAFPYDQFQELVTSYQKKWKTSAAMKERIKVFDRQPYLHTRAAEQP